MQTHGDAASLFPLSLSLMDFQAHIRNLKTDDVQHVKAKKKFKKDLMSYVIILCKQPHIQVCPHSHGSTGYIAGCMSCPVFKSVCGKFFENDSETA